MITPTRKTAMSFPAARPSGNSTPAPLSRAVGPAALVLACLTVFLLLVSAVPSASAAEPLVPCDVPVDGDKYAYDGEANVVPQAKFRKKLKKLNLRLSTVTPANNFTGRPTFPVAELNFSNGNKKVGRVELAGGIKFSDGRGKRVRLTGLKAVLKKGARSYVVAKKGAGKVRLFNLFGGRLKLNRAEGLSELTNATTRLSGAGARFIRDRLGVKAVKTGKKNGRTKWKQPAPLRKGARYGKTSVFAYRELSVAGNPLGEAPTPPPVLQRPVSAESLVSAKILWRVRESFIGYVNSGDGTRVEDGAIEGPVESIGSSGPLVYSFEFPFSDGWTDEPSGTAAAYGSGLVGFRYCMNTINFTVSNPEVELNGDASRLIFRVNGIDGTPYPNSRAVMVELKLNQAASKTVAGNTTTYTDIPAFVPAGSTGVFADIYPAGDPFGSLTLELTEGP